MLSFKGGGVPLSVKNKEKNLLFTTIVKNMYSSYLVSFLASRENFRPKRTYFRQNSIIEEGSSWLSITRFVLLIVVLVLIFG